MPQFGVSPPGRYWDLGSYRVHAEIRGEGSPAVVLLSSAAAFDWQLVLPEISKFTTVLSYDRAGLGWSEVSQVGKDLGSMTAELEALLRVSALPRPHIVVAHAGAGLLARRFVDLHRELVCGMVLVDSAHEQEWARMPVSQRAFADAMRMFKALSFLARLRLLSPTLRLLGGPGGPYRALPRQAREAMVSWLSHPDSAVALRAELEQLLPELQAGTPPRSLGDLPLIVLEATRDRPSEWSLLQRELAQLSRRGIVQRVEDCGHYIPIEKPDAVVNAVRDVLRQCLSGRVQDDA